MKRSEINEIVQQAEAFIAGFGFALPPFARFAPEELRAHAGSAILRRRLGWDVTDYGGGDFARLGLVLFTLRNGDVADLAAGQGMLYAEKLLVLRRNQLCPMHRHMFKTEDIINRGGARVVVDLFASGPDGRRDADATVTVMCDGQPRHLPAGGALALDPGESVTLRPGDWHAFRSEGGDCLLGEVSTVNDDETDNRFDPALPRFAHITEDATPWRLLVSDYAQIESERARGVV